MSELPTWLCRLAKLGLVQGHETLAPEAILVHAWYGHLATDRKRGEKVGDGIMFMSRPQASTSAWSAVKQESWWGSVG
jgi:hypothetical protein